MLKKSVEIVLVGNPNCGKTTLFNTLTGARQHVGNWAGVTVESVSGTFCVEGLSFQVVDLPGTYTLTALAPHGPQDENLTTQYLRTQSYSCVLNVVDAAHLERNLYVTIQCLEQHNPTIVVLNRNQKIAVQKFSEALGCPVVSIDAREGVGVESLKQMLMDPPKLKNPWKIDYPPVIEAALKRLEEVYLAETGKKLTRFQGLCYLEGEPFEAGILTAQALKAGQELVQEEMGTSADVLIATTRYSFIEQLLLKVKEVSQNELPSQQKKWTQRLDKVICHRYLGIPIFLVAIYTLFFFAINVGGFFQDYIEHAAHFIFVDQMSEGLKKLDAPLWMIAIMGAGGEGLTTVLTFVPVIGAMFFALAFFEDLGYMARAAFVVDRLMRAIGLPGKSFVPMIVGFGCNVPAIMGMRTLENKRDRILAVMMSPFMSCGARLAIFTVFVAAFFPIGGQNIVFSLYAIGILMAILTGWLLKKTVLRGEPAPLLLEMPDYQWPQMRTLLFHAWHRLKRFILNAGKLIVCVCLFMGVLNNISIDGQWFPSVPKTSVLAEVGKKITPIFSPMGIEEENWPAAVGLLTGILAKEVVIGTLNALYAETTSETHPVYGEMVTRFNGQTGAFAYLLFVLLYFPCISATAAMLREVQKGWTLFAVCWTTGLAYGVAVVYYQTATFFAHPLQSISWIGGLSIGAMLAFCGIRHYGKESFPKIFPTPIRVLSD